MKRNEILIAQRQHAMAKAILELLEEEYKKLEKQYILDKKIVNPDGSIPKLIYCIDDEETFNKANEDFSANDKSGIWGRILQAREKLEVTENNLIIESLKLAPNLARDTLTAEAKINYTVRKKLLDLATRLDIKTIPV